jgi:hypothetical protein
MAEANEGGNLSPLWVLAGGGIIAGLYFLLRPKDGPGRTEAAELPPLETPSEFESLGAVASALDDVKTNWRMGRYDAPRTLSEADRLLSAVEALRARGVGEAASATALTSEIGKLVDDVTEYVSVARA